MKYLQGEGTQDSLYTVNADALRGILNGKSRDAWMAALQGADEWDQTCACTYFTEDAMVFSLPGNDSVRHVETAVGYGDLEEFRTGGALWDKIAPAPARNTTDPACSLLPMEG